MTSLVIVLFTVGLLGLVFLADAWLALFVFSSFSHFV